MKTGPPGLTNNSLVSEQTTGNTLSWRIGASPGGLMAEVTRWGWQVSLWPGLVSGGVVCLEAGVG